MERHRVDGDGDGWALGMTHGAQSGCFVYQLHHYPAMDRTQRVGVLREHEVIESDLAVSYSLTVHGVGSTNVT
jgi:hypothetical protein